MCKFAKEFHAQREKTFNDEKHFLDVYPLRQHNRLLSVRHPKCWFIYCKIRMNNKR